MKNPEKKQLPVTRIQKLIGSLMLKSKRQKPSCYLRVNVDVTELVKFRKPYCKAVGTRVTTNDFFYCAMARAAKKFPRITAQFDSDEKTMHIPENVGIGFAVAAPQGLVAPVIKNITEKPLPQIAEESDALLKKARSNKLTLDDFEGACLNFTSLGMYGVSSFYAIIPPISNAILAIGKITEKIVPINGNPARRKIMSVTLTADRKLVNQVCAAKFLNCVAEHLQNPESLTQ